LIQHNNPDRLEKKLGIGKRLTRIKNKELGMRDEEPEIIHAATGEEEAEEIVKKISTLTSQLSPLKLGSPPSTPPAPKFCAKMATTLVFLPRL